MVWFLGMLVEFGQELMVDGFVVVFFMRLSLKLRDDFYEEVRYDKMWYQCFIWSCGEWIFGSLISLVFCFECFLWWNKVKLEKENFDFL